MEVEDMNKIVTNCYGIVVTSGGVWKISSDLICKDDTEEFRAAMHTIESLVLAHACAGIDISNPAYLEGIETVVDACTNNMDIDIGEE